MTKLVWGAVGERYYEAGADRGVLYLPGVPGVPWNGLISVKESPKGGEIKPYHIDGLKYAQVATSEEFEATIEAFSSPPEFGQCDGFVSIANGLFVTQQPRKPFGLCYRTRVGNDIDALDHGYKLHLIYGALAGPSSRDNSTVSASADPIKFSWPIETIAPIIVGHRPTAHFVVDSRFTPSVLLLELEASLYGDVSTDPYMPTASELMALFAL